MTTFRTVFSCLLLAACSSNLDGGQTGQEQQGSGGTGSRAQSTAECDTNTAGLETSPPVSFQSLMPIFGLSCVTSQCHDAGSRAAGLYLGTPCTYDAAAQWTCRFPSLPSGVVSEVYADLLLPSRTAPEVHRVEPGDPDRSFLLDKLSDAQASHGYACMNQDPTKSDLPCGVAMPLTGAPLCAQPGAGREKFAAVAAWIAQGAPDN